MTLIILKFSPEMEDLIMQGRKCMTTQVTRKGEPGDIFIVRNRVYRLLTVLHTHSLEMLRYCYRDEGFNSFNDFKKYLISIYPEAEYSPILIHTFAYVGEWCPQFGVPGAVCSEPEKYCDLFYDCHGGRY